MNKEEKINWVSIILIIGGIILAIWLMDYLDRVYYENKGDRIYNQVEEVCDVIYLQQPQNIDLHEDCVNRGIDVFYEAN